MLPENNQQASNTLVAAVEDEDNSGVPLSERGKGESMPMDKRHPTWVFAIVGLTFFLVLIAMLLGMLAYVNIETPNPGP